jgi:hypothetical protein
MRRISKYWILITARIIDLALYIVGFGLLWRFSTWPIALSMFIIMWAMNFERRLDRY